MIFERQNYSEGIQVRFREGDLWLTQKGLADLYDVDRTVITKHLKNIYADLELEEKSTSAIFALVQKEGNRNVERKVNYYNLDAVISVGYRVNSDRTIQFRRWALNVLEDNM